MNILLKKIEKKSISFIITTNGDIIAFYLCRGDCIA